MAKMIEKKPVSDHIRVYPFPADKTKGDVVSIGSLIGIVDYDVLTGEEGSVDCGKEVAIFQAKTTDFSGAAAVGTDVKVDASGVMGAAGTVFGTIVAVGADTIDIVRV